MTRICVLQILDKRLASQIQALIDRDEQAPQADRDKVLHTFSVSFGSGIEADIKVCNGDSGLWVDAVLFDQGREVDTLEPSTLLLGEYEWEYAGNTYLAELVAE